MHPSTLLFLLLSLLLGANLSASEEKEGEQQQKPLRYHKLSPSLISNLSGGARYIRCDIQITTRDEAYLEQIELHSPALRHELLMLISDQKGAGLKTPKGKKKFQKTALKALQGVMTELSGSSMIENLFFTSYFVE